MAPLDEKMGDGTPMDDNHRGTQELTHEDGISRNSSILLPSSLPLLYFYSSNGGLLPLR